MPNYIKNRIVFEGKDKYINKIMESIKSFKMYIQIKNEYTKKFQPELSFINRVIDFNKITKAPKSLYIDSSSYGMMGEYIISGKSDISFLGYEEIKKRWSKMSNKDRKKSLKLGKKYIKNRLKYGFTTWYDWCIENWGVKWNAKQAVIKNNIIEFETAWSGITNLIKLLSSRHPNVNIKYIYADEDSGSNTGNLTIQNGEIIEDNSPKNQSSEAYKIFLELHPNCDYVKCIDGIYQYVDSDN